MTASSSASALYDDPSESETSYQLLSASENLKQSDKNLANNQSNQLLACVNDKSPILRFDITSGCLATQFSGGWKYGWSDNKTFRVIAVARDNLQQEIKYSKQTNQYRAQIKAWKNSNIIPDWSGLHAITRYQTADDLYIASIRYDGNVTIKVKFQGSYTTLAQTKLTNGVKNYLDESGHLATQQWYKINFSAIGEKLTLSLDGIELLSVNNKLLTDGKIAIRTDHVEAYLDDWLLVENEKVITEITNELVLSTTKESHDQCCFHNRQCFQAKNNQGVWETLSAEYQVIDPIIAKIDFVSVVTKIKNTELLIDKVAGYQTKNS